MSSRLRGTNAWPPAEERVGLGWKTEGGLIPRACVCEEAEEPAR